MVTEEAVTLDEEELPERLRLDPDVVEGLANRRVSEGRWVRWTAADGAILYRVPENDLAADGGAEDQGASRAAEGEEATPGGDLPEGAASDGDRSADAGERRVAAGAVAGDQGADPQDAVEQLRRQRDELEAERDRLRADLGTVRAECDRLRAQYEALQAERDEALKAADEVAGHWEALKAKRDALQAEVDRFQAAPLRNAIACLLGRSHL